MSNPQIDPTTDPVYKIDAVAKMFGVTPYTIRQWIKSGKIEAVKVNNRWRIMKSEVIRVANKEHG